MAIHDAPLRYRQHTLQQIRIVLLPASQETSSPKNFSGSVCAALKVPQVAHNTCFTLVFCGRGLALPTRSLFENKCQGQLCSGSNPPVAAEELRRLHLIHSGQADTLGCFAPARIHTMHPSYRCTSLTQKQALQLTVEAFHFVGTTDIGLSEHGLEIASCIFSTTPPYGPYTLVRNLNKSFCFIVPLSFAKLAWLHAGVTRNEPWRSFSRGLLQHRLHQSIEYEKSQCF